MNHSQSTSKNCLESDSKPPKHPPPNTSVYLVSTYVAALEIYWFFVERCGQDAGLVARYNHKTYRVLNTSSTTLMLQLWHSESSQWTTLLPRILLDSPAAVCGDLSSLGDIEDSLWQIWPISKDDSWLGSQESNGSSMLSQPTTEAKDPTFTSSATPELLTSTRPKSLTMTLVDKSERSWSWRFNTMEELEHFAQWLRRTDWISMSLPEQRGLLSRAPSNLALKRRTDVLSGGVELTGSRSESTLSAKVSSSYGETRTQRFVRSGPILMWLSRKRYAALKKYLQLAGWLWIVGALGYEFAYLVAGTFHIPGLGLTLLIVGFVLLELTRTRNNGED